ncbi:PF20097 family protein [Phycisphaerales bacterium AB-hyl4]|uniref:PF20097 family protein n=1 Tax=Natronomicrosphaera hydrolytica TaxID=3242702 RepID=A0ABV4U6N0_9BACT
MEEGFIPTAGGLHWYRRRETSGTDFAEALPGTFSWDRRSRLPAWRCKKCHIVAFRYGHGVARHLEDGASSNTEASEAAGGEGEASS